MEKLIKVLFVCLVSCNKFFISHKGRLDSSKWMFFWKNSEGGGGISDPKNDIADFLVSKQYILVVNFGKMSKKGGGGGGHLQSKKCHCKFTHIYEFSQKKKRNVISKKHPNWWRRSPLTWEKFVFVNINLIFWSYQASDFLWHVFEYNVHLGRLYLYFNQEFHVSEQ